MSTRNATERLARVSAGRRRLVIGAWALAVLASAAVIAGLLGSALTTDDDFTGSPESQRAEQLLRSAFPPVRADRAFHVDEAVIVSSTRITSKDPAFGRRLDTLAADLRAASARRVKPGPVSRDGHSSQASRSPSCSACCARGWRAPPLPTSSSSWMRRSNRERCRPRSRGRCATPR